MNRIARTFDALKRGGRKGLVGFLTAGDPDLQTSERNIREAIAGGLDVLELGVPFSDPTADGPTIQEASQRALAAGVCMRDVLGLVRRLRADHDLPIVLFGYVNPLFNYGYEKLCADAAEAGADGLLVVDLPFEESGELRPAMDAHGLCLIPLIAPTTGVERAGAVLERASGFVYYIMVTGVTGAREQLATDVAGHVEPMRRLTPLPIAVGFGISDGRQARAAAASADAVVVGSALVRAALGGSGAAFVRELRQGLDEGEGASDKGEGASDKGQGARGE